MSRPTVLSSIVLALALLGDSLLYAALPLYAGTFGISLTWAGALLSVNRLTRLFVYPLLAGVVAAAGLRRFTMAAATLAAASTLSFALAAGTAPLLVARVAWGIAFGSLSFATLAYATDIAEGAGRRVGLTLSLREFGPLASLTAGMSLVAAQGIRPTLAILGTASLLADPVAALLPERASSEPRRTTMAGFRITADDFLNAAVGLVADGIFPATIALLLAPAAGTSGAVIAAGSLLGLKRAAAIALSPLTGGVADRYGVRATTTSGLILTSAGAFLIAGGAVASGSIVLVCGGAVAATSLPLSAASLRGDARLAGIARLGMARDAGAAAGPLAAMALIAHAPLLYLASGVLLLLLTLLHHREGSGRANGRAM